jgi:hypothetical protein
VLRASSLEETDRDFRGWKVLKKQAFGVSRADAFRRATYSDSLSGIIDPSHHLGSDNRQCEFRTLLFRKIHYAQTELLERAADVGGCLHWADLCHGLLVAKFATYRATAQKSDLVRLHCLFPS